MVNTNSKRFYRKNHSHN